MTRTPTEIVRAIRESPIHRPQTLEERERLAFGLTLSEHIYADPTILEHGAATAAQWIGEGGPDVPRSVRDWEVLCRSGDIDSVQWALLTFSEYADEMRASLPFVGIVADAEAAAIRARVRAEKSPPQIPLAVWSEIAQIVDGHFGPVEFLAMCMYPHRMLTDAAGLERTVIEMLEAGDFEPVYTMLRWITTPPDADAPRLADQLRMPPV